MNASPPQSTPEQIAAVSSRGSISGSSVVPVADKPQIDRILIGVSGFWCHEDSISGTQMPLFTSSQAHSHKHVEPNQVPACLTAGLSFWSFRDQIEQLSALELLSVVEATLMEWCQKNINLLPEAKVQTALMNDQLKNPCIVCSVKTRCLPTEHWQFLQEDLQKVVSNLSRPVPGGLAHTINMYLASGFDQWALTDLGTLPAFVKNSSDTRHPLWLLKNQLIRARGPQVRSNKDARVGVAKSTQGKKSSKSTSVLSPLKNTLNSAPSTTLDSTVSTGFLGPLSKEERLKSKVFR